MPGPTGTPRLPTRNADVAIVGGGIAGLWLQDVLQRAGYETVLFERERLGAGQTIASQGMIHGGIKYALGGELTPAAQSIAAMPARWRRCLLHGAAAPGDVDLRGVPILSERYYLWADQAGLGRLAAFFASRLLSGRIERLRPAELPAALADPAFAGTAYVVDDLVLDVAALLSHLAAPHRSRIRRAAIMAADLTAAADRVDVHADGLTWQVQHLICTAGAGNAELLAHWPGPVPPMQQRPLHQVLVHDVSYPPLYAHWIANITRLEPRLTITSHRQRNGHWCWYLGGQLATDGVSREPAEQIAEARRELARALPWFDWSALPMSTLRAVRAEPRQSRGHRPDHAFVARAGRALVAWPTKLSLVPDLADRVLAALPAPTGHVSAAPDARAAEGAHATRHEPADTEAVPVAMPPWEA
jgi:glycerol-3-phosphate dehydrogenase